MDAGQNLYYPGPIALPSDRAWIDPPLVNRALYSRLTDVPVIGGEATRVAELSSLRWAVGFSLAPGSVQDGYLAPWSDNQPGYGVQLNVGAIVWYNLRDYGPLVCGEWFVYTGSGATVRLIEILRRTGG